MRPFPHRYTASASANPDGDVRLDSEGLPPIATAPPEAFGGPGDRWSPETLFVGAIADCFILTFRSLAEATSLPWLSLTCEAEDVLDRVDRVNSFTEVYVRATLVVPPDADETQSVQALERTERLCLITNSLRAEAHLDARVVHAEAEETV